MDIISEELSNIIINEVKNSVENLNYRYENNFIEENEYNDILFYCSMVLNENLGECYNLKIKKIIFNILTIIKNKIHTNELFYNISMYQGLGNLAFSVNNISEKTGKLTKLAYSLNRYLLDYWYEMLKYMEETTCYGYYDIISGISGVLYYLLDKEQLLLGKNKMKLNLMIRFLINMSKDYEYRGEDIIKFHIKEDQETEKERLSMKNGHINFGFAHGMMGPLITLAKSKKLGFEIEGLDLSIMKILTLYEKFCIRQGGVLKYPTKLPVEDYIKGSLNNLSVNCGWCYGNMSIVRGLMKVSNFINEDEKYKYYKEELLNIINQPIKEFNLKSPIACHGYSSVVAVQISAYKESEDKRFLYTLDRNILKIIDEHQKIINYDSEENQEKINYKKLYGVDYSLLNGSGGVMMVLMDSLTCNMKFNKILMVD